VHNPRVITDKLTSMNSEDWLQIIEAIDCSLVESLFKEFKLDQQGKETITKSQVISITRILNQFIRDAEYYRKLPSELRTFLASNHEALIILGCRLMEAVNAREQVTVIRDYISILNGTPNKCDECEPMEALKAIRSIVDSPLIDIKP
jgi:integrase